MARLRPHLVRWHPGFDGAGGKASAEAVAAVAIGCDPGPANPVPQDRGNGIAADAVSRDFAVTINGAEQGAVFIRQNITPRDQGRDRAVTGPAQRDADLATLAGLVSFGTPQGQDQALAHLVNISVIKPDQFRTAKATRSTDQQQGPVAVVAGRVAHCVEDQKQVFAQQGLGLILCGAFDPLDSAHRGPHDLALAGVGPIVRDMDLAQRRETPRKAGRGQRVGMVGQITGDLFRRGGQSAAPCRVMRKVGAIGLAGVVGDAGAYEGFRSLRQGIRPRRSGICGPG